MSFNRRNLLVRDALPLCRLSEWIFGGVTRELLGASKVPCLFSK